jgi:hypothetical protein
LLPTGLFLVLPTRHPSQDLLGLCVWLPLINVNDLGTLPSCCRIWLADLLGSGLSPFQLVLSAVEPSPALATHGVSSSSQASGLLAEGSQINREQEVSQRHLPHLSLLPLSLT